MQLRKETLTALVKSASVFVSYLSTSLVYFLTIAAGSHDVALARGNKTISAAHVMDAMRELEFPVSMRKELREQLQAYRELQKKQAELRAEAAAQNRERAKAARAAAAMAAADSEAMDVDPGSIADESHVADQDTSVPQNDDNELSNT